MVNIYKLKLTILQMEVLRFLTIKAERSFTAHAIAKALEVSQPGISKALPLLEKEQLISISKDKESKRLSIKLNRNKQHVIHLKRAENLRLIYESNLTEFLEQSFPGATIVLFGSFSRGEDTTSSDIDIVIIGIKERELDLKNYEKVLERKIRLNFYDSLSKIHKELRENICNGILLTGGIEL